MDPVECAYAAARRAHTRAPADTRTLPAVSLAYALTHSHARAPRAHARTHAHAHAPVLAHSGMDASSADTPCCDTPSFAHAHTRTRPRVAKHARGAGAGRFGYRAAKGGWASLDAR